MTANAVVSATYSDFKIVRTRSVAQIVLELPIEQAQGFVDMFGLPIPGSEIHVAIARLREAPAEAKPVDVSKSERGKELYRSKDAMEQAAIRACILCDDLKFQLWASKHSIPGAHSTTAEWLRAELRIKSRNEISSNARAYKAFLAIEEEYKQAAGLAAEMR